jgi:hypothetical protein
VSVRWATVLGLGLWMPGFPDADAWRRGVLAAPADAPPVRLSPRLRRRASLLIRMVAEVATQATECAGVSLSTIPVVVGSAFGELGTTIELLQEIETETPLSPFRFHNSVHNTAASYLSIAHENHTASTSLAAGNDTVAMVLLEAMSLLASRGGDVLVVVADEALPQTLARHGTTALSAAAVLRAGPADGPPARGAGALALAGDLRQETDPRPAAERPVEDDGPCGTFLRFVAAVQAARETDRAKRVELTSGGASRWSIAIAPPRAA